ncbi:hypothetical protein GRF29_161g422979 [Pseudopithomyces chartarum]|uniref:Uncharacterized protein n=1 Tax=Pseudopithomyces chartarum TaxID=1892770 RepID=A0AAN6RFM1_9PLEO|nr:hypothetical protein GRF29_161g422979 [Pseudopithomyces chartarum]
MLVPSDQQHLQDEIADLEQRLQAAKSRLNPSSTHVTPSPTSSAPDADASTSTSAALHALLLLADSALPLGSFAFSSGLESYLAHHRPRAPSASQLPSFSTFLRLSLSTLASTSLPYVLAGYRRPGDIQALDNDFDASTPCPAQGGGVLVFVLACEDGGECRGEGERHGAVSGAGGVGEWGVAGED